MSDGTSPGYVARYRFTPFVVVVVPLVALVMVGGVGLGLVRLYQQSLRPETTSAEIMVGSVVGIVFTVVSVFFGWLTLNWVLAAARRWIALGVDEYGVTLGRHPFPGSRPVTVPWRDVEAVVLFVTMGRGGGPCVGLQLRPTADRPAGGPRAGTLLGWLYRQLMTAPATPADVLLGIRGWDLDDGRLATAVHAFALHVEFVDFGEPWPRMDPRRY